MARKVVPFGEFDKRKKQQEIDKKGAENQEIRNKVFQCFPTLIHMLKERVLTLKQVLDLVNFLITHFIISKEALRVDLSVEPEFLATQTANKKPPVKPVQGTDTFIENIKEAVNQGLFAKSGAIAILKVCKYNYNLSQLKQ